MRVQQPFQFHSPDVTSGCVNPNETIKPIYELDIGATWRPALRWVEQAAANVMTIDATRPDGGLCGNNLDSLPVENSGGGPAKQRALGWYRAMDDQLGSEPPIRGSVRRQ